MLTTVVAGRTWQFSHSIGRPTAEHNGKTGGFMYPIGVAAVSGGILFVLSRGFGLPSFSDGVADIYRRIGKVRIDQEHIGDFARCEFTWPSGIAVAGDGRVFCADEHENDISFYDSDGVIAFPEYDPEGERLGDWGEQGTAPGQINGPAGLAFDADDNLYVVDSRNDRVQHFTKDGRYLSGWGESGSAEGQFKRPWGITVDGDGFVYVADWGNDRVQKFTADGEHILTFGSEIDDGGELDHPADVGVDSDGDVYVADWGNRRVQIYEANGDVITALYGDAKERSKAEEYLFNRNASTAQVFNQNSDSGGFEVLGKFGRTSALAVDDEDRIIVADSRGRLQVYQKDHDYVDLTP
jgi:sugar lactone lactonase YvrE